MHPHFHQLNMNSRHFIQHRYGSVLNGIRCGSQIAAEIHGMDQIRGKRGAFADHGRKRNPFRGIAHSNGSSYNQRYFRHVEGARDVRRTWQCRRIVSLLKPFRDINPVPVSFCE